MEYLSWVMHMKVVNKIGEQIHKSGYRDDYISEKLGVSKKQVWNWKKGVSYPTFEKSFFLAALLGCKVDDLGEITEERDNNE